MRLKVPTITSEEVARWRRTVEAPADVVALEAHRDWLLAHDPRRGRLLRTRMRTTTPWRDLASNHYAAEKKAWITALGIEGCEEIDFDPLPSCLHMNAARIESLGRVLDQLPFLRINLDFYDVAPTEAVLAGIFASPVVAKIRHLSFRAYSDQMDPDENCQAVLRTHYGDRVFAALCASPNITQLETLWILDEQVGGHCAAALAAIPFTRLRELRIYREPIGDAGAAALANAPCLASLRRLALTACNVGDVGAFALAGSPYLEQLEELEVSGNDRLTASGKAALRSLRHLSAPPALVGIQTTPRAESTFDEALATSGRKVMVSAEPDDGKRTLMIYGLSGNGARQLAYRHVPEDEHDALVPALKTRGVESADSDFPCDFVWILNGDRIEVYDSNCKVLDASGDRATLADGRVVLRADIARVIAFAAADHAHRGIKAVLRSGQVVPLVTEALGAAMGDPTYNRNDLLWETGWTSTLGRAIATWAAAEFEDQV